MDNKTHKEKQNLEQKLHLLREDLVADPFSEASHRIAAEITQIKARIAKLEGRRTNQW